ncbi:MAG: DUF1289 domain-containing protein [Oceanospirillales bacterium]|nr:DUF1289 domain-containing protein [Oceanospirillales bacterium]MBR9886353.1 DUF1289 domain-containing protein [Oceanospirillales bacterium]
MNTNKRTLSALPRDTNSPCVRNCCLDNGDICMGCYRSLEEILAWHALTESERDAVSVLCQARKKARQTNWD